MTSHSGQGRAELIYDLCHRILKNLPDAVENVDDVDDADGVDDVDDKCRVELFCAAQRMSPAKAWL